MKKMRIQDVPAGGIFRMQNETDRFLKTGRTVRPQPVFADKPLGVYYCVLNLDHNPMKFEEDMVLCGGNIPEDVEVIFLNSCQMHAPFACYR